MKHIISLIVSVFLLLSAFAFAENATSELQGMYAEAELLMAQGDYSGAASKFETLGAYSDASQMAMYCKAIAAAETLAMYDMAVMTFQQLGDFRDSKQMVTYYTARGNETAADAVDLDIETTSITALNLAISKYEQAEEGYAQLALFKDCLTRLGDCRIKRAVVEGKIPELKEYMAEREAQAREEQYQKAIEMENAGNYSGAANTYQLLGDYKDSRERLRRCSWTVYVQIQTADQFPLPGGLYFGMTADEAIARYQQDGREYSVTERQSIAGPAITCVPVLSGARSISEKDIEHAWFGNNRLDGWAVYYDDHGKEDYDLIEEELSDLYGASAITNETRRFLSGYINGTIRESGEDDWYYNPDNPEKSLENWKTETYYYEWYSRYSIRLFELQNGDVIIIEHNKRATGHTMGVDETADHSWEQIVCNLYSADSVRELSVNSY